MDDQLIAQIITILFDGTPTEKEVIERLYPKIYKAFTFTGPIYLTFQILRENCFERGEVLKYNTFQYSMTVGKKRYRVKTTIEEMGVDELSEGMTYFNSQTKSGQ